VVSAVGAILDQNPHRDVVLVGHGTAWTLVRSAMTGDPPALDRWARLSLADVECVSGAGRDDMLTP
jgi:broad specificity phosphatase PhoE